MLNLTVSLSHRTLVLVSAVGEAASATECDDTNGDLANLCLSSISPP